MSSPRSASVLLIALAVLSWSIPSQAQDAPGEEVERAEPVTQADVEEARRRFEQGVALFREENVEAALAEFRASYRINPLPQVLFNIAVSQRRLHRYAEAVDTLRQYLDEGVDEARERRELASELIEELEAVLASVRLEVSEEDADVFVDGELIGRTPLESAMRLASGDHEIEVHLDGFRTHRQRVEVHGGQDISLPVELEPVRRPWYRRWWVWTIIGAAVVGTSVGLGVGLTNSPRGAEFEVVVERGEP